jgi:hypothetical protein
MVSFVSFLRGLKIECRLKEERSVFSCSGNVICRPATRRASILTPSFIDVVNIENKMTTKPVVERLLGDRVRSRNHPAR